MKQIFYSLMALALLTGCSNEDMMPDITKEGAVQLASVSVGSHTRGTLFDNNFVFGSGDQVLMSALVNGSTVYNTFTYDGNRWTQDAPAGKYSTIYWQDNPGIKAIVSSGGKPALPVYAVRSLDQSSEEKYTAAYLMKADLSMPIGSISITDDKVSAELALDCVDFVVKVRDGEGSANVLDEDTPVLTVTIDINGLSPGSVTDDYIAWNAGKSQDENGDWYTTFRVILPHKCTVQKATLSKANAAAGEATTEIKFFWTESGEPSDKEDLKRGIRYSSTYEYNEYLSMTSVGISIMPFDEYAEQDIIASSDWSFDATTKTYTVFTAEGLQIVNRAIHDNMDDKGAYNITLAADIALPDPVAPETSNWIPLGHEVIDLDNYIYEEYPYSGVFDGAGHVISNLRINNDDTENICVGLIGLIGDGGAVKNLTLDNPEITSTSSCVGGLVGRFNYDKNNNTTIINCHIEGGCIKSAFEVGGIAGEYNGDMLACTVNGTIIEGYSKVGGIIGFQYHGRIIACGVDGVNLRCSDNWFGGIAGFWGATGLSQSPGYMYSCYAKDCTKGTDSQALEGTANLLGAFGVSEGYSLIAKNCAYRAKNGTITYGLGGTDVPTNNNYLSSELFTETGTANSDWPTASRDLNVGIDEWNGFDPTLPCNWEWSTATTEEGKLKVKQ